MLLANYDSDSDASDASGPSSPPAKPAATAAAPAPAAKPAAAAGKKRKGPVKISLDLPKPEKGTGDKADSGGDAEEDAGRPAKRKGGAGSSALLGMLPPPKRKLPVASTPGTAGLRVNRSMATPAASASGAATGAAENDDDDDGLGPVPKVVKRKADADLDLFGLSAPAPSKLPKTETPTASAKPPAVSSAPAVADFVPPEPTAVDPYPGYYQLPSGEWAAYEPGYYASFFAAGSSEGGLVAEEKRRAGRIGRDWAALDDGRADVLDVDASTGLAAARAEAERTARLAKPRLPADEFQYDPIGQTKGLAQERHQLSSLLSSAYSQRDDLENRIAENKKNMRMAQQKYGF